MQHVLRWVLLHGLPALSIVELHPIVLAILYFASAFQCLGEQISKIIVIWRVLKSKISDIAQILVELLGESITQNLDRSCLFLFSNLLIFLLIRSSLES